MNEKTATIEDVIKKAALRERIDIHTALPARVVSFDPAAKTVRVEPMINQVLEDDSESELPVLVDVPVQFPEGGGFVITFPLIAGDEGLVVFNERCIDGWWATGRKSRPLDFRLHDYSDAVFIPGVTSRPNAVPDFYTGGASLQSKDGQTYLRMTTGKIYIKADLEIEGSTKQTGDIDLTGKQTIKGNLTVSGTTTTNGLNAGAGGGTATFNGTINHYGTFNIYGNFYHYNGTMVSLGRNVSGTHTHPYTSGDANTGAPNT